MSIGTTINPTSVPPHLAARVQEYNAAVKSGDLPGNVQAFVQHVLRESYLESTEDLYMYAEKVKFFNACKQKIRDELTRARNHMSTHGAAVTDEASIPPFVTKPLNLDFNAAGAGDAAAAQQVNTADTLSGGGLHAFNKNKAPGGSDLAAANLTGFDVVTTEAGYTVAYKGSTVKVYDPSGEEMLDVSGDPHVYMGGADDGHSLNGSNTFHFGRDSTFVLPDGTKLGLGTSKTASGEWYTTSVAVMSGDKIAQLDGKSGTAVSITNNRAAWDAAHADRSGDISAGVFMVTTSGQCLGQASDGKWYSVKSETWAAYKSDRDIDLNTKEAGTLSAEQQRATLDGSSVTAAAGGAKVTKADLDAYIKEMEEKLSSVGDDAQLANVDLQNMLQKQQQTMQQMSNISKMLHDTAMAVIRKIGG